MAKIPFRERLAQGPILADGAMGTMLHQTGVRLHACFDSLNVSDPGLVANVHRQYIEAGSEIIETNTFSANPLKLKEYNLQDDTIEINQAGYELAHRVVEATFRDNVYIAGSVGPLGVHLAPYGRLREEQAYDAFRKQISALIHSGVDLILLETFSDLSEIEIAIKVARDVRAEIPIVASMTFTRDDRTLMGDTPASVAKALHQAGVDVIGVNCSSGPSQLRRILTLMQRTVPEARFSVMPNAGWPEMVNGRVLYPATPDYFGDYAKSFVEAGATIIGGCCGTTPQHIQAMRKALDDQSSTPAIFVSLPEAEANGDVDVPEQPTELQRKLQAGKFVITVEMAPPRSFVAQKVLAAAEMLHSAGVDTINVSDSPMARLRMSPWAVAHFIQDQIGMETVLHFPTRGRNLLRVQGDLLASHALGVRNIFVVMGDPTHIGDYPDAFDHHDVVPTGLLKIIKHQFNQGMDQAGNSISQPTSFFVGTALNFNPPDLNKEVNLLKKKIDSGADFALTQPVFEPAAAERFLRRYEELMGKLEIPILAGILPLYSSRHGNFLHNEVPGIVIPDNIKDRIERAGENAATEGVHIAQELILELKGMVQGVYLMPQFGRYNLAAEIVDALALPTPL
ncbi:MAG: bifunctional homocysteine S-methyltransferase/methylenetetrahydrofolate reductase [Chloroflexota bacterium]|nr:bifunctional homocysteine S-methyltransferase/methylenetetrahydrofolate reductase [Chloroflexota bacterium]NOG63755.1 bifunctional homocysteine S-methyltransferase/methylenetetrahydrofolate reductase [Chloroflexota bacterium]GIK65011.1 MAG: bifunctional homocysteine S-methyltransferase/methylenetetrahydrofolate reductase [Chloroflexota bacterium]